MINKSTEQATANRGRMTSTTPKNEPNPLFGIE